jgi:putative membrane-bound dehydrogenase-like protein
MLELVLGLWLQGYPEGVRNTEDPKFVPRAPAEALRTFTVPEGFRVELLAAEPDVAQPISIAFDERGRLWVAECYSYETPAGPWKSPVRDRILIFEEGGADGRFARRKVFWDQARNLTSVLPGFGGVWLCSTPRLLFVPDRDRDDVPDGEPEVLLDGWNDGPIGHCVFNGLQWGPDGWLWGHQGIQGESRVGRPGAPDAERVRFNGGIWRYHPTRRIFEVVCEGTTNPWGLDFDDWGQAFFTNCVIGHLWHVIPGAHYERMYGQDFTPNTYGLIPATSDHLHFAGSNWQASREGRGEHDVKGGGHAHAGGMIYLADQWPPKYRNTIFMNNIHGHRINNDILERAGSGYVGRHGADLLRSTDEGFRGVALKSGPDGGVFVGDWHDVGECHDTNAVHRTSGRIYKITYGRPAPAAPFDLARRSDAELVALQLHANDWWVRQSRLILQERAAVGVNLTAARVKLFEILRQNADVTRRLRALWALQCAGGLSEPDLTALLDDGSEHVRSWAVRLLCEDRRPSPEAARKFSSMAESDLSPLVRLFLASMLQRMEGAMRWPIITNLARRQEDAGDPNLPLMIWYGLEPIVASDRERATALVSETKIPLLRRFLSRRLASLK